MVGCCVSFFVSLIEDLRFGCAPVGVCLALQVSTGWKGFVCVCVCVKRTNGEEGVASRMQLPGHQM